LSAARLIPALCSIQSRLSPLRHPLVFLRTDCNIQTQTGEILCFSAGKMTHKINLPCYQSLTDSVDEWQTYQIFVRTETVSTSDTFNLQQKYSDLADDAFNGS